MRRFTFTFSVARPIFFLLYLVVIRGRPVRLSRWWRGAAVGIGIIGPGAVIINVMDLIMTSIHPSIHRSRSSGTDKQNSLGR